MQAKEKWLTRFRFSKAIGVIDCTHIRLDGKPAQFVDEYVNQKGFASINVQVTCDQNSVITSIDASRPGSVHDARIWKNSAVCEVMKKTRNTILLGDSGYGIMSCLMTSYTDPHEEYRRVFNTERVVIEYTVGQVKRRFPILKYGCRVEMTSIPKVIIACSVLHNISKQLRDEDFQENDEDEEQDLPFIENENVDAIRAQ
ncbi:unnamed protein product [Acanthoscelides obtectus]|uniref:DDE Tnp4 domain-containing protein n=1 Tax=Acanthoscelides obtectus TaxID=200917 RepID=A0A9P0QGS9_ACAOB|nr:unnamed protein product [Acanthoscelides obtectus]CAH2019801.1 unnamed protein product [Acanthoscelides obtectus]CAK1682400.1 Putative nuclease HARBI1 [Acanthoscelides obtectus]CAK1687763.1 Putative nuclease HARBI1 [Acanthoscelides obtectus]